MGLGPHSGFNMHFESKLMTEYQKYSGLSKASCTVISYLFCRMRIQTLKMKVRKRKHLAMMVVTEMMMMMRMRKN